MSIDTYAAVSAPARGMARLEFALMVIVIGIGLAIAMNRLDELQVAGRLAMARLVVTQERAAAILQKAHCANPAASWAASSPCTSPAP